MNKFTCLIILFFCASQSLKAQSQLRCAQTKAYTNQVSLSWLQNWKSNTAPKTEQRTNSLYYVPLYFHLLGQESTLTKSDIAKFVLTSNKIMQGSGSQSITNFSNSPIVKHFKNKGLLANTDIKFCLFKNQNNNKDVAANYPASSFTRIDKLVPLITTQPPLNLSFSSKYHVLNVLGAKLEEDLVGRGIYPLEYYDPINGLGAVETAVEKASKGKWLLFLNTDYFSEWYNALPHEFGHNAGLFHIFDGGCDEDYNDLINDTPVQETEYFDNSYPEILKGHLLDSCQNHAGFDMYINPMDYTGQVMTAFTPNQKAVMEYYLEKDFGIKKVTIGSSEEKEIMQYCYSEQELINLASNNSNTPAQHLDESSFDIFPNPISLQNTNALSLSFKNSIGIHEQIRIINYQIYDLNGKLISNNKVLKDTLSKDVNLELNNTSLGLPGMYLIKFEFQNTKGISITDKPLSKKLILL